MGISADLIISVDKDYHLTNNDCVILDDLEENKDLYSFVDKKYHHLIYKETSSIVDLDKMSDFYNMEMALTGYYYGCHVSYTFNNKIHLTEHDVFFKDVEYNCLNFKSILYLGSSSNFNKDIFNFYENKDAFNSLLTFEEFLQFYNFKDSHINQNYIFDLFNKHKKNLLFIDLNY